MVLKCEDCGIWISVSSSGYGDDNVVAKFINATMGQKFATKWQTCAKCGNPYCEQCARKRGGLFRKPKCACGGVLSEKNNVGPNQFYARTCGACGTLNDRKSTVCTKCGRKF